MKLRMPDKEAPSWLPAQFTETRLRVTTITPIYGGGIDPGEPDPEMPIRAAAIRGQLRFWWRLLNRGRFGDDFRKLFEEERKIWGAMGEPNKNWASKVQLRVREVHNYRTAPCAEFKTNPKTGRYRGAPEFRKDVSTYALFPGQGQLAQGGKEIQKEPAQIVLPGLEFTLRVACDPSLWQGEIEPVLRWWASFGGIGSRTRRGLGSIRTDDLPPVTEAEVAQQGLILRKLVVMSNATDAWKTAVDKLRVFRQGENIGRNPGQQPNRPGRSRWPESDAIRRITGKVRVKGDGTRFDPVHPAGNVFPRALFGLPIIFHFQGEKADQEPDPADTQLVPAGADRFTSPLILKAIWDGKGYRPIALLLPIISANLHARSLVLQNSGKGKDLDEDVSLPAGEWWPTSTGAVQETAAAIGPIKDRGTANPLLAFLDFFEKGR